MARHLPGQVVPYLLVWESAERPAVLAELAEAQPTATSILLVEAARVQYPFQTGSTAAAVAVTLHLAAVAGAVLVVPDLLPDWLALPIQAAAVAVAAVPQPELQAQAAVLADIARS
jgi:hypothetical protein